MKTISLEIKEIADRLTYDPDTGLLRWRMDIGRKIKSGSVAGHVGKPRNNRTLDYPVISIRLNYKSYLAHRLAWALFYGEWPPSILDHKNGNPSDNRIENLRIATHSENMRNKKTPSHNKSGYKGVSFCKCTGKWVARIRDSENKYWNLGRYECPKVAYEKYCEASKMLHGDFSRLR